MEKPKSERFVSRFTTTGRRPERMSFAVWLASGLGVGIVAPAPGTVAALWGIPLTLLIQQAPGWYWQFAAIAALNLAGIPLCARAERDFGAVKDHPAIVWDEIATVPLAFFLVPLSGWLVGVIGFALLRVIDIAKPPPLHRLERMPGGLGIMADDILAGIYTGLILAGLAWIDRSAGWGLLGAT